jgi:hypothetical protein
MSYRNGALRCDKPFCRVTVVHWVEQFARKDAHAAGWHVNEHCACVWRNDYPKQEWKHYRDYCPDHFPESPRAMQTLRSPLL